MPLTNRKLTNINLRGKYKAATEKLYNSGYRLRAMDSLKESPFLELELWVKADGPQDTLAGIFVQKCANGDWVMVNTFWGESIAIN